MFGIFLTRTSGSVGLTVLVLTAAVLPTDKKDYTFRSFWDREDCFRILTAFLNKFRGITTENPAPSKLRGRERASTTAAGLLPPSAAAVDSTSADSNDAPAPAPASATLDEATIQSRHQSLPIMRKRTPETPLPSPMSAPAVVAATSPPAPAAAVAPVAGAAAAGSGDQDAEFETGTNSVSFLSFSTTIHLVGMLSGTSNAHQWLEICT